MCIHAHPDIPLASRKMTDTLCSICVTSVSLGSSMDLNITHLCACSNRWFFSDWPRLWLEGSHRRVGKLDRRWGASDRRQEGEGEVVAWMTKGDLLHGGQSHPDWGVQSNPRARLLRSCVLSHTGRRHLAWSLPWPVWDSWSWGTHICRTCEMDWGSWLVLGVHHPDGIAVLSSIHRVFATLHEWTLSTAADLPQYLGLKRCRVHSWHQPSHHPGRLGHIYLSERVCW